MAISRIGKKQPQLQRHGRSQRYLRISSFRSVRFIIICLAFIAIVPPIFFHFRLRRFHQMQLRKCGWLNNPPLVCAHGGDSTKAFPNTMDAYRIALHSQVDCIEIDVSRSSDGVLFALHDRELQRISGNMTAKVGYLSMKEIKELDTIYQIPREYSDVKIPTIEDALMLISGSVQQVILDAKVGPPSYEKGLAKDILSAVGYIVMKDPSTGARTNLLRMKAARIVGVYHPLIDEKLVRILRGYDLPLQLYPHFSKQLPASLYSIFHSRFLTGGTRRCTPGLLMMKPRWRECWSSVLMPWLPATRPCFSASCKTLEPSVSKKVFLHHNIFNFLFPFSFFLFLFIISH
ncbi:glycerophosphodiester phosphodiesterase GDPD4-like isoform X2 [Vitis riparia]|uniref:glycerophosphodiester phosphodiesterase GDPD4-like isoform X2 n=1 Tax=Vitis riparia TaxID=96939 RepID=UPI00155AA511|nr:glycerophosphodiester phosphodiesterase GDPD4-like isoform X2 [Vitis riparia]